MLMQCNLVLRRLRYALDLRNHELLAIFKLAEYTISDEELRPLLLREQDEGFVECTIEQLSFFLDGLIVHMRGARTSTPEETPRPKVLASTNNVVLRKLRIALDLREEGLLELIELGGFRMSKHELSALFRKEGNRHFRMCGDQVLRYFLGGLTKKRRPDDVVDLDVDLDVEPAS